MTTGVISLSLSAWVLVDARRRGRGAWSNALATLVFGPVGLAVYLGMRRAADHAKSSDLNPEGERLLVEVTAEIKHLREELTAAHLELERLRAERPLRGSS